jgi:predicted PurR-regulated permease PerM
VTIIFITVNQLDGLFIAPKIVGESVGLHPLTVIISVLAWSLILGGLLGALLAVPLTASIKVLLKRYFWDRPAAPETRQLEPETPEAPPASPA